MPIISLLFDINSYLENSVPRISYSVDLDYGKIEKAKLGLDENRLYLYSVEKKECMQIRFVDSLSKFNEAKLFKSEDYVYIEGFNEDFILQLVRPSLAKQSYIFRTKNGEIWEEGYEREASGDGSWKWRNATIEEAHWCRCKIDADED